MIGGRIRWARLDRVYVAGGYPVADVTDRWGGSYRALRFLGAGGGAGNFAGGVGVGGASELPTDGNAAEVALLYPEGRGAVRPWVLAGVQHPDDASAVTDDTEAPEPGADYTAHHVTDHVTLRDGARVVVSELAGVVVQGLPGQPVRVQVAGTDQVRISSDGAAVESLLLGVTTRAYIDGLVAQVEALRAALVRLENWASSATGAGGSVPSYTFWEGPGEIAPVTPYLPTTPALESAIMAVSAKAKG
jgi:hypothetical protein